MTTRTWRISTAPVRCGSCDTAIAAGVRFQAIAIPGMKRELVRCEACVKGYLAILAQLDTPEEPSS